MQQRSVQSITPEYVRSDNETSYSDGTRGHVLITSGGEAPDADYARVLLTPPCEWTEEEIQADVERFQSCPFSFFR